MNPTTDERLGLPSCSELHRIMGCPGYLRAKEEWPKHNPTSADAAAGTEGHRRLAEAMRNGKPVQAAGLDDNTVFAVEHAADIANRVISSIFKDRQITRIIEMRFWMSNSEGRRAFSGQPDVVVGDGKEWLVIDYKLGSNIVPNSAYNWQIAGNMVCFADGGLKEMMTGPAAKKDIEINKMYGCIIQPLVSLQPRLVEVDMGQILNLMRQIRRQLAKQPVGARIPGEHCEYCPFRVVCPERVALAHVFCHRFAKFGELSPEQLAAIVPKLSGIEKLCSDIRDYVRMRLQEDPKSIPGLKLGTREGRYSVKDLKGLRDAVGPLVSKEVFNSLLTLSVSELAPFWISASSEKNGTTKKEAAAAWKAQILSLPCLEQGPSIHVIQPDKQGATPEPAKLQETVL